MKELFRKRVEAHKARKNIIRMENRVKYYEEDSVFANEGKYLGYPNTQKSIGY